MEIFIEDLLAGIVIVVSAILLIVASIAYKRYRMGAALVAAFIFLMFLLKGILYEINNYMHLPFDLLTSFLLVDVIILVSLYFALALRNDGS